MREKKGEDTLTFFLSQRAFVSFALILHNIKLT
jgi:hypothetical protein